MPLRATTVAAAAALTLSAQPARADVAPSAYPTCNATLNNLVATYSNGNYATLEIFSDGANGTNCAYLRHGSAAPGGEDRYIDVNNSTSPGALPLGRHCD